MDFNPPTLIGTHCIVRPLIESDIPAIFLDYCDPKTMQYLKFMSFENKPEAFYLFKQSLHASLEKQKKGLCIRWVITSLDQSKIYGTSAYTDIHVGYKNGSYGTILHHNFWGQKIALEARLMALEYGFEKLGLKRIDFQTTDKNILVQKHFKKLNIPLEGIKKKFIHHHNEIYDQWTYAIFDTEWDDYKQKWKSLLATQKK